MQIISASTRPHIFLWILGFLLLLSFPEFTRTDNMDSLSTSFTIEVDGSPIAKVGSDAEDRAQANTGPDAAVFTLKDGRLQSGDWVLARPTREDRSFAPKPVRWFKAGAEGDKLPVHTVTAHEDGESYQIKFASMEDSPQISVSGGLSVLPDAGLIVEDGKVLADLQGERPSKVVVKTV